MKLKLFMLLSMIVPTLGAGAQMPAAQPGNVFVGRWEGNLQVGVARLPLVVRIAGAGSAWFDSPSQGVTGYAFSKCTITGSGVTLEAAALGITITADLGADGATLTCKFTQMGQPFPLTLTRVSANPYLPRPQEPAGELPYEQREVSFGHDGITLAGTLTLPRGGKALTAVVLVSGSGCHNRNEEVFGHKPFLVLSDYLTRAGVAVLRYDDRGAGGSSPRASDATTAHFAQDAIAAVRFLRDNAPEVNPDKIGIIGHSEGGLIAMMLAADYAKEIGFIVTLAGPAQPGRDLMVRQNVEMMKLAGAFPSQQELERTESIFSAICSINDTSALKAKLETLLGEGLGAEAAMQARAQVPTLISPWYVAFVRSQPGEYIKRIACPMMAVNGTYDVQVTADANLDIIKALYHGPALEVKRYPGVNHLMQECDKPSLDYGLIEQTFSPTILADIAAWIAKQ